MMLANDGHNDNVSASRFGIGITKAVAPVDDFSSFKIRCKSAESLDSRLSMGEDMSQFEYSCSSILDETLCVTPPSMTKKLFTGPEDDFPFLVTTTVTGKECQLRKAITDKDVCFKKWKHPGTKKWRQMVQMFSDNKEKYPIWCDEIGGLVQIELRKAHGIDRFLLCRDDDGNPSKSTANGKWYEATAQEILERTKQRFSDNRKNRKSSDNNKEVSGLVPLCLPENASNPFNNTAILSLADYTTILTEMLVKCREAVEQQPMNALTPPAAAILSMKLQAMQSEFACLTELVSRKMNEALGATSAATLASSMEAEEASVDKTYSTFTMEQDEDAEVCAYTEWAQATSSDACNHNNAISADMATVEPNCREILRFRSDSSWGEIVKVLFDTNQDSLENPSHKIDVCHMDQDIDDLSLLSMSSSGLQSPTTDDEAANFPTRYYAIDQPLTDFDVPALLKQIARRKSPVSVVDNESNLSHKGPELNQLQSTFVSSTCFKPISTSTCFKPISTDM